MPIEAALVGVVASTGNAFITLWKHGSHFVEIPEEVEQFKIAIDNLETALNTTRRLRRVNSRYLDQATKAEVDGTIGRSQSVLDSICRTIENCRADLQVKGTVRFKNRMSWILAGHDQFMSRGMTLNSCLQVLGMHIQRMDGIKPTVEISIARADDRLPSYNESVSERRLRAPSMRRRALPRKSVDAMNMCPEEVRMDNVDSRDDASMYAPDNLHVDMGVRDLDQPFCEGDYCVNELCTCQDRIPAPSFPIDGIKQASVVQGYIGGYSDTGQSVITPTMKYVPKVSYSSTSSLRRNKSGLL